MLYENGYSKMVPEKNLCRFSFAIALAHSFALKLILTTILEIKTFAIFLAIVDYIFGQ